MVIVGRYLNVIACFPKQFRINNQHIATEFDNVEHVLKAHCGRGHLDHILQATFSSSFSCMENVAF